MDEPLIHGASLGTGDAALQAPVVGEVPVVPEGIVPGDDPLNASYVKPVSLAGAAPVFDLAAAIDEHQSPLLRYVGHLVDSEADRQDVVQEAFLRLHRQVQRQGRGSIQSIPAWLAQVAHHLATDLVRKKVAERKLHRATAARMQSGEVATEVTADPLGDMARREAADRALAEMEKLPPDQKNILLLRLIQGMKLGEISRATGLTTGNAAYRINQALSELARRLKASGVV